MAAGAIASAQRASPPPLDRPPTVADPIRGLNLWQGAKVGMTVADVRRQFPAAVVPATPTILTGGQVDRLMLAEQDLAGRPATAHFYFAGSELVSVELTVSDLRPAERARNLSEARTIAAHYTAQYRTSYDCGSRSLGDIDAYECKWLSDRVSIQLWYMDVAGQAPLFYVAYKQADDPSYNL